MWQVCKPALRCARRTSHPSRSSPLDLIPFPAKLRFTLHCEKGDTMRNGDSDLNQVSGVAARDKAAASSSRR